MQTNSAGATILVVDDDDDIRELLRYNLEREAYTVRCASDGVEALVAVRSSAPDLLILDLMMPRMNGLDVTKAIKGSPETAHIPIIILSARGEETDVVLGLELGADDYMAKPFSLRVLLARVKAALRKTNLDAPHEPEKLRGVSIDKETFRAWIDGQEINLTATEFRILQIFFNKPGRVFTRSQIVDSARGEDYAVTDRSVDVHIVSLRKKMGVHGSMIETVRGIGYRFKG